ncbi:MAG: hypothetical protein AABX86_00895 [Nanoarchaeota archaeon]
MHLMESYPVTITASLDEELQHTTTASFAGYQPDNNERDEDSFACDWSVQPNEEGEGQCRSR